MQLLKEVHELLKNREFISVATADAHCHPNAAPKFLLKTEGHFVYLIDYTFGKTWHNLKNNPRVSMSFMNTDTLVGYQINGKGEIIDTGKDYEEILKELVAKEISLSTKRIIEGVTSGKKHASFEVEIREQFVIIKVRIEEISEIGPKGEIKKETYD